jgi:hypothetical protein
MRKKFVAISVTIFLLLSMTAFVRSSNGNDSYVIIVAPQEQADWQPVIDELLLYHPNAVVLVLPPEIQSVVMDLDRQVKYMLMDGGLKVYLWLEYWAWGSRSIPVPMGYYRSGDKAQTNVILHLDRHKADVRDLFYNWFEKELGHQPHYVALVGDIKTRRSDWVSAMGMTLWWDYSLPYPADAWPSSISAQQVPVAYCPYVIEECLSWYGYACGRITGDTIADAVALVDRAGTYNEWAAANTDKAGRFLASFTVGVYDYYAQMPSMLTGAGFNLAWYTPEGPPDGYPTWANIQAELSQGVGYWHLTCHGNFQTGMGGPGNGLITFDDGHHYYYDIEIGGETPAGGWSGEIWDFINNDYLASKTSATLDVAPAMPSLDHTVVRVTSCMTGNSEMPLQFVSRGAVAVIMGITSQEVCEGDCDAAYFYNALTHTNPATGTQYSIGEAMAYANVNTHVLHYYYATMAGMNYWSTMYLIGDPALVPYVPNVGGTPPALDPAGNNPGAYPGGSQQIIGSYYVPMAIERPDGSISVINVGNIEKSGGASTARPR